MRAIASGSSTRASRTPSSKPSEVGLVPNFTEGRVKRLARILESNESLIDDVWQLAV